MNIQPISNLLAAIHLGPPVLRALTPNVDNYIACLFQPNGNIQANADGVRNQDRTLANKQFSGFLQVAETANADLSVTPEYSMPWEVLKDAIKAGRAPAQGQLWALGCESIRYSELAALKAELAPHATILHEQLQADDQRFVDPLAYVFVAPSLLPNTDAKLVVLIQFKTCPMGGTHFEVNGLQRGTCVYQFGGGPNEPRLLSLICSDAFEFLDAQAAAVYDRALVLHIQLNPQPRQTQYRKYRDRLFGFAGDATELICLNWAKDVRETQGDAGTCWQNISGSAWYLRPDRFDDQDTTLSLNHKRGLYYTWCQDMRLHALFFNYEPGIYVVTASKVFHHGVPASLSLRRGPQLTGMRAWDNTSSAWIDRAHHQDGFDAVLTECGNAHQSVKQIADANPFHAERVLALSAGHVGADASWYHPRKLDSCGIDLSEVIRRMTFCQDTDAVGRDFRNRRLRRCSRLWDILKNETLPPAIRDLKDGFKLDWAPHQNVVSTTGRRATAVYMGEEAGDGDIEAAGKRIAEHLRKSAASEDEAIEARQRFHIWYRNPEGSLQLFDRARYLTISDPRSGSEFDIARVT